MKQQPWASGPGEILQHGLSLLHEDSDVNRRLAMLTIDNSVELMIKTYLGLPKRATGIIMSRKDYLKISESFPRLLVALEKNAPDKLAGVDLAVLEWYHRLRNQLYHQGNGLTVEKSMVQVYAQLATLLFENLFGFKLPIVREGVSDSETASLERFLSRWNDVTKLVVRVAGEIDPTEENVKWHRTPPIQTAEKLAGNGLISSDTLLTLQQLAHIRNRVVHGRANVTIIRPEMIEKMDDIMKELQAVLDLQ